MRFGYKNRYSIEVKIIAIEKRKWTRENNELHRYNHQYDCDVIEIRNDIKVIA